MTTVPSGRTAVARFGDHPNRLVSPSQSPPRSLPLAASTTTGSEQSAAPDPLTTFLIGQPTAVTALLVDHADDGTGKCPKCGGRAIGDRSPWPCTTYNAASQASRLAGR